MSNLDQTQPMSGIFGQRAIRRPAGKRRNQGMFRRLIALLFTWQERNMMRRKLLTMSDHMLKDIGLTRAQVMREANKPFWEM